MLELKLILTPGYLTWTISDFNAAMSLVMMSVSPGAVNFSFMPSSCLATQHPSPKEEDAEGGGKKIHQRFIGALLDCARH